MPEGLKILVAVLVLGGGGESIDIRNLFITYNLLRLGDLRLLLSDLLQRGLLHLLQGLLRSKFLGRGLEFYK